MNSEGWPTLGFGIDTDPALARFNPLNLHEGTVAGRRRRGRHRRRGRPTSRVRGRRHRRDLDPAAEAGVRGRRGREVRRGREPRRDQLRRVHDPAAQELLGREGQYDAISVAADEGISEDELVTAIQPVLPGDAEVVSATRGGPGAGRRGERVHLDLPLLPARLRRDRALRRRVRHLQHLLDHGRAADARVRDAADARGVAAPGPRLGDPRVARHRPARVARRPRPGRRARRGHRGALRQPRRRAAERRSRLRDEDDRRLARRRRRDHAPRRPLPGDPRHSRAADLGRARGRDASAGPLPSLHAVGRGARRRRLAAPPRRGRCSPTSSARRPPPVHRRRRAAPVPRRRDALVAASSSRSPRSWGPRRAAPEARRAGSRAATPSATPADRCDCGRADDRHRARLVHRDAHERDEGVEPRGDRGADRRRLRRDLARRLHAVRRRRRRRARRVARRRGRDERPLGRGARRRRHDGGRRHRARHDRRRVRLRLAGRATTASSRRSERRRRS